MTEETKIEAPASAPTADQPVNTNVELNINDLAALRSIVDVASTRGAFKAAEMSAVGNVFNKLDTFLAAVVPAQAAEQANQAQAQ
jgi:hypothetical protein